MKVLIELRPAFDGHSGIPQEARLLFNGLAGIDGVEVVGLIQSSNLVAEPGLPFRRGRPAPELSREAAMDRLSKVVVSLQQGSAGNRLEYIRRRLLLVFGSFGAALGSTYGRNVQLGGFDATHFKDFIWRALFAKSLDEADFGTVTRSAYRVLRWPWAALHAVGVVTGYLGRALYPRLDTTGIDVVVAETPFPSRVSGRTRLVVRYHDAIPLLMPHTIKNRGYHRAAHYRALLQNVRDGAWFACVSEATRQDLISVVPDVADKAVTIPNMVSDRYFIDERPAGRVAEVVWSRKNRRAPHAGGADIASGDLSDGKLPYLLMVSTIEPRKNHLALLDAWELLRSDGHPHLNLVVVGSLGWEHEAILERFGPWLQRGGLHLLENVPADDLRLLYRHAEATVCPSFGEGFDFPGIEALRCGGVVAASDIPVHRGVFADACVYFNPYAAADLARSVRAVLGPDAGPRRTELLAHGARVSARYLPDIILPQWRRFLDTVAGAS